MQEDFEGFRDLRERMGRAEANIASLTSVAAAATANLATVMAGLADLRSEFRATADARRQDQIEFFAAQRDIAHNLERKMAELKDEVRDEIRVELIDFKTAQIVPLQEQLKALAGKVSIVGVGIILVGVIAKALGVVIPVVTK